MCDAPARCVAHSLIAGLAFSPRFFGSLGLGLVGEFDFHRRLIVRQLRVIRTRDDHSLPERAIVWTGDNAQLTQPTWREANYTFHDIQFPAPLCFNFARKSATKVAAR